MDDVTMDEPTMNFLSLPDEFQLQIFKKLDWKSLKDLKLVCRDLYFLIEKNIEHLDRPKLGELVVYYDREEVKHFSYTLRNHYFHLFESKRKIYFPISKEQYNRFLKERDFSEVKKIGFLNRWIRANVEEPEVDEPYSRGIQEYVEILEVDPHEIKFDGYFFKISDDDASYDYFDDYGVDQTFVTIEISSNTDWRTLYYDSYIKSNSLQEHGFFKKNGSISIAVKLVMDCITGNPNLKYSSTSTDSEKRYLHMEISEHLFKHNYFNLEGRCNGKKIWLTFEFFGLLSDLEKSFYRGIFDKIKFGNNLEEISDEDGSFLIQTFMNCQKCGKKHFNQVFFTMRKNELEILLA